VPEFVAIVGSRSLPQQAWPWVKDVLDRELADSEVAVFLSGGAKGADRLAERYVWQVPCSWTEDGRWIVTREFPGVSIDQAVARGFMLIILPNYKKHGKHAPLIRNTEIAENCTWLIALVDGQMSAGTGHVVGEASRLGKRVTVHTWEGGRGPR
jgi:hypothetical protein